MFLSSFCTRKANKLFSNNGTFTEAMIQAFLCYVLSVYPRGIKICKLMDPLAQYIIKGWPFNDYWPDSGTLEKLGSYMQIEEKERSGFKGNWVSVEATVSLMSTVFS